jgi:hypothetical protein
MILPDFNTLWEPYAIDGATLEGTRKWLLKTCTGIPEAVVDQAIVETMLLLAEGHSFLEPCSCGCGLTNAHTAIEHYIASRAKSLHNAAEKARSEVLQMSLHNLMLDHIASENAAFEAANQKDSKLKRAWNWIKTGPVEKKEEE